MIVRVINCQCYSICLECHQQKPFLSVQCYCSILTKHFARVVYLVFHCHPMTCQVPHCKMLFESVGKLYETVLSTSLQMLCYCIELNAWKPVFHTNHAWNRNNFWKYSCKKLLGKVVCEGSLVLVVWPATINSYGIFAHTTLHRFLCAQKTIRNTLKRHFVRKLGTAPTHSSSVLFLAIVRATLRGKVLQRRCICLGFPM